LLFSATLCLIVGFFDPTSLILAAILGYLGLRSLAHSGYEREVEKAEQVKQEVYEKHIGGLKRIDVNITDMSAAKLDINAMPELITMTRETELRYDKCSDFIVLDIKTTGRNPEKNKITEFAAVKFHDFGPVEYMTMKMDPNDMDDNAATIGKALPSLIHFVGESKTIVAHNMLFVIRFLYANGFDLFKTERKYYDTLQIAKKYFDFDNYKLETLCKHFAVYYSKEHCALHECVATGQLFEEILTNYNE